jgi:hypothetical protein
MQRQYIIALAALMMALPAASATWYAYGTYEPDTAYDTSFVQSDANVDPASKELYFNVYQTEFLVGTSTNSGTAGSRIQMAGVQNFNAMLGPWRDCNADGYVGFAESALIVYRAELLLDAGICPAGDDFHNDGTWVYEYIPVGSDPREVPQNVHPMQIDDPDALVWGDAGIPGASAAATCPISPFPHGTTSGSGWMIRFLDCFASRRVANTVNTVDSDGSLGLRFDDVNNTQDSDSLLNQQLPESLFGDPNTQETGALQLDSNEDGGDRDYAFTTWDCNGRAAEVKDPTDGALHTIEVADPTYDEETGNGDLGGNTGRAVWANFSDDENTMAWVAEPAPSSVDPTRSFADAANETFMGVHAGSDNYNDDTTVGGDCNFESDNGDGDNTYSSLHTTVFFRADAPFEQPTSVKKETDDYFIYYNGGETDGTTTTVFGPNAPNSVVSTPPTQFTGTIGAADPIWQSNTLWATTPQSINRGTLQPQGATYWSFYGKVGSVTLSQGYTGTGATAKYGSEACGSFTSGVHNGWDCQASHWYTGVNGEPIVDGNEIWQARAGFTYQFRDIDCFDGSAARGAGVHASLVDASEAGTCADSLL